MIRTDIQAMLPIARPKGSVTGTLPVLISVPATAVRISRQHHHSAHRSSDLRVILLADRQRPTGTRKRRLKREVRAAARVVTVCAALLLVTTFGPSLRVPAAPLLAMPVSPRTSLQVVAHNVSVPLAAPAAPTAEVATINPEITDEPTIVLLSAEPQLMAPGPESDVPVILPGYVLPAESFEEPVHEGR